MFIVGGNQAILVPDPFIPEFWYNNLDVHAFGEYSYAEHSYQPAIGRKADFARLQLEYCLEHGRRATFTGVYDNHGLYHAPPFIADALLTTIIVHAKVRGSFSEEVFKSAFTEIDEEYYLHLKNEIKNSDSSAQAADLENAGSSCLVGLICENRLYIGNLGNSRAVIGMECITRGLWGKGVKIVAEQITNDHSLSNEKIRKELLEKNKDEPFVVAKIAEVWRIKGITEISRSIGDFYLKKTDFQVNPSVPRHPILRPLVRNDAEIHIRTIKPADKFIVFGSAGFWELISNEQAVEIVHSNSKEGIAKTLLEAAWNVAGGNPKKNISIMVLFFDHSLMNRYAEMELNVLRPSDFRSGTTPLVEYNLT